MQNVNNTGTKKGSITK